MNGSDDKECFQGKRLVCPGPCGEAVLQAVGKVIGQTDSGELGAAPQSLWRQENAQDRH